MIDFLKKLYTHPQCVGSEGTATIDIDALDNSLKLLQETTLSVSQAAIGATQHLQEQLKSTEHRFFSTIDAIDDIVIIKDSKNRWKTVNLAGQRLFGFTRDDYFNKTNQEIAEHFPRLQNCLRFVEDTDLFTWELKIAYRYDETVPNIHDDDIQYFDIVKTPTFFPDGTPKELIVIGRNVTEAHIHIKRQRACFLALNSVSDAIIILDKNGQLFFANDIFLKAFCNNVNMDSIVGQTLKELIPDFNNYDEMWDTVTHNVSWNNRANYTKYRVVAMPMMNGADSPIFYICTVKEATQLTPYMRKHIQPMQNGATKYIY